MSADHLEKARKALRKMIKESGGWNPEPAPGSSFAELMAECWWSVEYDEDENVVGITFEGEKQGYCEEEALEVIAEYVKEGSYVEMKGEDGERWKWEFRNGKLETIRGKVVWEDDETN